MKFIKYLFIFLIPLLATTAVIIAYFKITQKVSGLSLPTLPSFSVGDVVKLSRFSLEKAPSQSLTGDMIEFSGEVKYQSRLATESAQIRDKVSLQQGDIVETGTDGSIKIVFTKTAEISMVGSTKVNIVQTLPANLVFMQYKGSVEYKKLATTPVSIRALHLLIDNGGDIEVSFDPEKPIITVKAVTGSATIAFNNLKNSTQVITLEEGKTLTFNDSTRRPTIINN